MLRALVLPAVLLVLALPGPAQAQIDISLDELDPLRTAIGVGIVHQGAYDRLYAVGAIEWEGTPPVDSTITFRAPGLTKVLIAMTARALAASGQIDLEEPIGLILPGVDPAVGRITLQQLFHHASGLDDAVLLEGQSWGAALDKLDERAFVLPPGTVTSHSRYSFPLALRVLEQLAGAPFAQVAETLIFGPLQLTSTSVGGAAQLPRYEHDEEGDSVRRAPTPDTVLGLPVTVTSAPDLLTLAAAWAAGGIPGSSPTPPAILPPDRRAVNQRDGMQVTAGGAAAVLSTQGVHWLVVPATGTSSVRWTNGPNAPRTDLRVALRVRDLSGAPILGAPPAPAPTADAPEDPEPEAAASEFEFGSVEDWAGRYRNGSAATELRLIDGRLHVWDGREANPMRHVGGGVLELDRAGYAGASIRLARIGEERVAFFGNLVYRLEGPAGG